MAEHSPPPGADADAAFLGWQVSMSGTLVPFFNITAADHPSFGSTVSEATLRKLRLRIPPTPSPYDRTGPSPWHTLGIDLHHPKTAREAIQIAGLDYTVVRKPVPATGGDMREGFATVRTDTGEVLGTVGPDYEPVQNRDAFSFFDVLVDKHDAVYETAGILGHGERMWLLAKLPGYMKIHGNDLVNKYLLLTNSHDGRATVRVKLAPIRLVCNNTLTSAVKGAGQRYICQATDAPQRADNAVALLGMTGVFFDRLELLFNAMAEKTITEKELHEYVQTLVPDSDHDGDHAATDKVRSAVLELHESGWGAHLARGTVWGAFNSVTEYTDHVMLGDDPARRLTSIWFGSGERFKMRAFQLAERFLQA